MPGTTTTPKRPIHVGLFSDSRTHGYSGPTRHVRIGRVAPSGGASLAKSEDGARCAIAGKESLRIVTVTNPDPGHTNSGGGHGHKTAVGLGGSKIETSRNFWDNSGLKIDSASTDVAWGHGSFNNKILTSARNGEIILWDIHKSGNVKYERRTKDHIRSINKLSVSRVVQYYCITGSADGDMRIWDLRDLTKSVMRVKHPTSIRSIVFSPNVDKPLQAVVGLDNGSIHRWDLKMGQRGALDRLAVAHSAPITSLDWCGPMVAGGGGSSGGGTPADGGNSSGMGWLVSGGLDKCVKVWDLTSPSASAHISSKPTYTLHPSFPVRRVSWRPGFDCELAVVSNEEVASPAMEVVSSASPSSSLPGLLSRVGSGLGLDAMLKGKHLASGDLHQLAQAAIGDMQQQQRASQASLPGAIEIWDVRREWLAKWSVSGSSADGSISDIAFGDSHALWAQQSSGSFTQFDLREVTKPIDSINRVVTTWEPDGAVTFVAEVEPRWEAPYDDIVQLEGRPGSTELRRTANKTLGDAPIRLSGQTFGAWAPTDALEDVQLFGYLARNYVLQGKDKQTICNENAQVAYRIGHSRAFQIWSLMATSLVEYTPKAPPTPPSPSPGPKSRKGSASIKSQPLPAPSNSYAFPPPMMSGGADPHMRRSPSGQQQASRNATHSSSRSRSVSSVRRLTPTSSTNSSPLHMSGGLPPITPNRGGFSLSRRESVDSGGVRKQQQQQQQQQQRNSGNLRRMSISGGPYLPIPGEKPSLSLKHVGEGALDDSSSESEGGPPPSSSTTVVPLDWDRGNAYITGVTGAGAGATASDAFRASLTSPLITLSNQVAVPSPLSRVAGQSHSGDDSSSSEHARDSDDDGQSSASPRSTDTEKSSDESSHSRRQARFRSKRYSAQRLNKTRSRSSTLASLPASQAHTAPAPSRQASHSSIRTVVAAEQAASAAASSTRDGSEPGGRKSRQQSQSHSLGPHAPDATALLGARSTSHLRHKSNPFDNSVADLDAGDAGNELGGGYASDASQPPAVSKRRIEVIRDAEHELKEMVWGTLRESVEELADEGDVQLCAMLSLIAQKELGIPLTQVFRFVEAYIERLAQARLYTCAAYIRKFSDLESIKAKSLEETVIYTTCGKCHKPLIKPAGGTAADSSHYIQSGAFSFCLKCKSSVLSCAICRLPVRSLLFQCSVCKHGGHQSCFREFYLRHPMTDLSFSPHPHFLGTTDAAAPNANANAYTPDQPSQRLQKLYTQALHLQKRVSVDDNASIGSGGTADSGGGGGGGAPGTSGSGGNLTGAGGGGGGSIYASSEAGEAGTTILESPVGTDGSVPPVARLMGHPCAAGCGHFCWAANTVVDEPVP